MERMEGMLFEAAAKGNVNSLRKILKEDPLILDRVTINYLSETPLHIASMLGHVDFVKEIIKIKPQITAEMNLMQSSPLHLASAKGHVEVVRALLSANPRTSLVRDRNGMMPLHLAAIKGHVDVVQELLLHKKLAQHDRDEAARATVYREENVLHLCVRFYQLEVLKLLVKIIGGPEFINSRDADGNTILHIAVAYKDVETIKFLLCIAAMEVNALNLNGMTAMDILSQSHSDMRDDEIKESLKHAGGFGTIEPNTTPLRPINQSSASSRATTPHHSISTTRNHKNEWESLLKRQDDWLERKKGTLMIVASLIATMAFQVGVNPPSGVWQDDKTETNSQGSPAESAPHRAGLSIMARNHPSGYIQFYIVNTVGFIASLSIILLLISGLPIRRKFFMWILMLITWIAITAIALVYVMSIVILTPSEQESFIRQVIAFSILIWLVLMALLLVAHTIRLIVKFLKKVYRFFRPRSYSRFMPA